VPAEGKQNGDDDEDEVTKVRVDFLRNPYFDDHFDITDSHHLVGKTMMAIGKTDGSIMGNSVRAVGLAYYNRWDKLQDYLDKLDSPVLAETVDLAVAAIEKQAPENGEKLMNTFAKLTIENKSLIEESKKAVLEAVNKNEDKEIQFQKQVCKSVYLCNFPCNLLFLILNFQIYKEWESFRREELQRYMEHLNKMKRLQKVQQIKQELREKEQLLFFFDNENKYDLIKEEKVKRMKKKQTTTKSTKDDLTYIPPEIRKPGFKRD